MTSQTSLPAAAADTDGVAANLAPPLELDRPAGVTWGVYVRWAFFLLCLACLYLPPKHLDPLFRLPQFNRFLTLALFALSVDMIWGYTGLLSLGQGLYFGMGAYIAAWSLKLQMAAVKAADPQLFPDMVKKFGEDERLRYIPGLPVALTDYMEQCRLPDVPGWLAPLIDFRLALVLALLVPTLFAFAFGWLVFKRRIKGVYFSLVTQALVLAVFHLVSNQRPYTGGVDGQTDLAPLQLFGFDFEDAMPMYYLVAGILAVFAVFCFILVHTKFGKILTAIRDNEYRVMALGYNTAMFKTAVFALSGFMAALAGVLFVSVNQSAGPQFFSIGESIEVVIFVAVGGRGTITGAIIGALLVSWGKDYINTAFAQLWPVVLGGLFVAVVLFLPEGLVGGVPRLFRFTKIWFRRRVGLSTSWNVVRIGIGLMYWGLAFVLIVNVWLRVLTFTVPAQGGEEPAPVFSGLVGSSMYWMLLFGSIAAAIGWLLCCAMPANTRARLLAVGSVAALCLFAFFLRGTLQAPPAPVNGVEVVEAAAPAEGAEAAKATLVPAWLVAALGLLSLALAALLVREIARFYQHEALAGRALGFLFLGAGLIAAHAIVWALAGPATGHPLLTPLVFLVRMSALGMTIVLPIWFLRLLYQAHECINRPLAV